MPTDRATIYQHPLALLLGLEGIALLRAWAGDFDERFVHARFAEVRRLLDDAALSGLGVQVLRGDTQTGYRQLAEVYDEHLSYEKEFGAGMFAAAETILREILDARPAGVALDAACGTGRVAGYLDARGHRVIGVDSSPEMLAVARRRLPEVDFREGLLGRLPLPDASVDVAVCTLALCHVPDLRPVLAEFARVVRADKSSTQLSAHIGRHSDHPIDGIVEHVRKGRQIHPDVFNAVVDAAVPEADSPARMGFRHGRRRRASRGLSSRPFGHVPLSFRRWPVRLIHGPLSGLNR